MRYFLAFVLLACSVASAQTPAPQPAAPTGAAKGQDIFDVLAAAKGPFKNNLFNFFSVEQSCNSSLRETRAVSGAHAPSPRRSP